MSNSSDRLFGIMLIAALCLTCSVSARSRQSKETDAGKCSANETLGTGCEYLCLIKKTVYAVEYEPICRKQRDENCMCREGYCLIYEGEGSYRCVKQRIIHCLDNELSKDLEYHCREYKPWPRPKNPDEDPPITCSANQTFAKGVEYFCYAESMRSFTPDPISRRSRARECICREGFCLTYEPMGLIRCLEQPIIHCNRTLGPSPEEKCSEFNPWPRRKKPDDDLPSEEPAKYRSGVDEDTDAEDYLD